MDWEGCTPVALAIPPHSTSVPSVANWRLACKFNLVHSAESKAYQSPLCDIANCRMVFTCQKC